MLYWTWVLLSFMLISYFESMGVLQFMCKSYSSPICYAYYPHARFWIFESLQFSWNLGRASRKVSRRISRLGKAFPSLHFMASYSCHASSQTFKIVGNLSGSYVYHPMTVVVCLAKYLFVFLLDFFGDRYMLKESLGNINNTYKFGEIFKLMLKL